MLPGFNHNIRYKERVYHVQTEDNGLKQPRLITQVFIDGHVLALEKSTYDHIIEAAADDKSRDDQIRTQMQDQHKQLLKNLVAGMYDERIAAYLHGGNAEPSSDLVPAAALAAAEEIPYAPSDIHLLTDDVEAIIIDAPEVITPESLLDPEFLLEIGASIEAETSREPPPRPPTPIAHLAEDLLPEEDFLSKLDEEVKKKLPFDPSDEAPTQRPSPAQPPPQPQPQPQRAGTGRAPKPIRRHQPQAADTLVDFGLPAALRETLERKRKTKAGSNDTLMDMELKNVAASLRPVTEAAAADAAKNTDVEEPKDPVADDESQDIVVMERSLDEVILSYLADDQD